MTPPQDRRFEPRTAANARAILVAPGLELLCLVTDQSGAGMRLRLDRGIALPRTVVIVDVAAGLAIEADVAWTKGQEAGLKRKGQASLRGLVPARLAAARAAFARAGGR